MKLLSLCVILIISFHYIWINRIEIKPVGDGMSIIVNKWTGNYCSIHYAEKVNERMKASSSTKATVCQFDENGKIIFP